MLGEIKMAINAHGIITKYLHVLWRKIFPTYLNFGLFVISWVRLKMEDCRVLELMKVTSGIAINAQVVIISLQLTSDTETETSPLLYFKFVIS